ncbi:SulP family inorganic anion transporter [Nocardia africana]|uniref:Probable sulfate transporter Rv1739c/MT1781 n=1 Tax=Nocardia africana TaxID=134964 RepID=A0A378WP36_9NOCA|nr:SulP family inorganic anion transporter [Nocardia africana]MCC3314692.1 STAS domain-containing protein [Nocardia africana]SUA43026.1 Probable sulfate transporter Rv1739c/MT1781 [Nocardia africana]
MSSVVAPTLTGYRRTWLRADIVAGLSAGAVVIPQAMAYATIADLPVQIGLYTCMVPMVVYALLGGSRTTSVSTTSTIATLTASTLVGAGIAAGSADAQTSLMTLTLLVGVVLVLARLARLGSIIENISDATLTGIKIGVGLTVAAGQLPKLLGVPADPAATGFFRVLWSALRQLGSANPATVILAAAGIAGLYAMSTLLPRVPGPLVVVAVGIALVAFAHLDDHGVALIAPVPSGIPLPGVPRLHDIGDLLPGALAISMMAFLETVAVGRGVRRASEPQIDSNRELFANGMASLAGSFFHTLPPAGGFSQTAVALRAGARTQVAAIVTAALAVAVALFLAPVLDDLPQATLGAMVVVATLGLLDFGALALFWRVSRVEFWIAAGTAAIGLVMGLLPAVAAGVVATLYLVLRELNRPHVVQLTRGPDGRWAGGTPTAATEPANPLVLRVASGLYTANVRANTEGIRRRVDELAAAGHPVHTVVLDCSWIPDVTLTVMRAFLDVVNELQDSGVTVYFAELPARNLATVRRTARGRVLQEQGRLFTTVDRAVTALTPD